MPYNKDFLEISLGPGLFLIRRQCNYGKYELQSSVIKYFIDHVFHPDDHGSGPETHLMLKYVFHIADIL